MQSLIGDPASLYLGRVVHARLRPRRHRFSYRVFSLLIDIDRLGEADAGSLLFSVNRFNLVSFHERDHGPGDGTSLRKHVDKLLSERGIRVEKSRIRLLCFPRILGYVFNPLSVYYVHRADGSLAAVLYEVRNTFGERHTYAVPIGSGNQSAGIRHRVAKALHVSPFLGMSASYRFSLNTPGDSIRLRIMVDDVRGPLLATRLAGHRWTLSTAALLKCLREVPLMALKVIVGIHWEALNLWRKRVPIHPHPSRRPAPSRTGSPIAEAGDPS